MTIKNCDKRQIKGNIARYIEYNYTMEKNRHILYISFAE